MKTQKLTYKSEILHKPNEIVTRGIVDLLTQDELSTSIWTPKEPDMILPEIIGHNRVVQGKAVCFPISSHGTFYERGFWDPEKQDATYFINHKTKVLCKIPGSSDLFYDQDKVRGENRYVWHGTFDEILQEFEDAGYKFINGDK